jgi:hypothetical protein
LRNHMERSVAGSPRTSFCTEIRRKRPRAGLPVETLFAVRQKRLAECRAVHGEAIVTGSNPSWLDL